jgi:hypothetical protein
LYFSAIERLPRKSLSEAAHALLTSRGFVDG